MRVLRILNVDDLIDGLVFCKYSDEDFSCKPERVFFDEVRFFIRCGSAASPDARLGFGNGRDHRPFEMLLH